MKPLSFSIKNPLVHGPTLGHAELLGEEPVAWIGRFDSNTTNPLQDLWALVRRPRKFFEQFKSGPQATGGWLWGKAIVGALVAIWVSEFVVNAQLFRELIPQLVSQIDPSTIKFLESRLHINSLSIKLKLLLSVFAQFRLIIAPFLSVTTVLAWTGAVCVGLRFVGIPWRQIVFSRILLIGIYLEWYAILALIPGVGELLVAGYTLVVAILAMRWIFTLDMWSSILAVHIVGYMISAALLFFAFVPMFTLFLFLCRI